MLECPCLIPSPRLLEEPASPLDLTCPVLVAAVAIRKVGEGFVCGAALQGGESRDCEGGLIVGL
jgi:hypothetical protein